MKRAIQSNTAPQPKGPYSQGIIAKKSLLFVSGQGPVDVETGEILRDSFQEQARRTLQNVQAVVEAAGATMADVVKVNVYLTDMDNFASMNDVYATFFPDPLPARTTAQSNLPKFDIEIDAVAVLQE